MINVIVAIGEKTSKTLVRDGRGKPDGSINKNPPNTLED